MAKKNKNKKNKKDTQTVDASTENNTLPVYESSAQRDDDSSKGMPMWQRILIVIVILLLVGFGWWIFTSNSNSDNNSDSQNTEQASNSDNNSSNSSSNNNSSQNESTPTPTSSATSTPTPTATPTPTSSNNNSSNNNSNTDNNSVTPVTETDTQYDYTAASGDSMTLFVRRSMLSYLENKKIDLNASQKIYVETLLTQQYGSPRLKVGQKVSVLKSDLEKWVNNAKALSSSAQAKWAKYAALVNY